VITNVFLGGIAATASNSDYCYIFLHSVVWLSQSFTLLIPFDGFRCHFAGTLVGSSDTLFQMSAIDTPVEGDILGPTSC